MKILTRIQNNSKNFTLAGRTNYCNFYFCETRKIEIKEDLLGKQVERDVASRDNGGFVSLIDFSVCVRHLNPSMLDEVHCRRLIIITLMLAL